MFLNEFLDDLNLAVYDRTGFDSHSEVVIACVLLSMCYAFLGCHRKLFFRLFKGSWSPVVGGEESCRATEYQQRWLQNW